MRAVALLALTLSACSAGDVAGNIVGGSVGGRFGDVARAAVGGAVDSVQQINTKYSPEQEYYLGRAVAAEAVARYGLDPNELYQQYVRNVGATLVATSERLKGTYGGYHFAVLDSDEANGISGPGGYVFVTRGAFERCQNEDELAAILAHELGHVSLHHGEKVIRSGRTHEAAIGTLFRVASAAGGADESALTGGMSKYMGEVAGDLVRTLAETGYGHDLEYEADYEGTLILYDVGYDAASVQDYLKASPKRQQSTWKTHPPAAARIDRLQATVDTYGKPFDGGVGKAARSARFQRILEGVVMDTEGAKPPPPTEEDVVGMPPLPPPVPLNPLDR